MSSSSHNASNRWSSNAFSLMPFLISVSLSPKFFSVTQSMMKSSSFILGCSLVKTFGWKWGSHYSLSPSYYCARVALANLRSDATVGIWTLFNGSDSIAITLVHFSSTFGLPLFLTSSSSITIPCLTGGSLMSWSNSVNSSSLIVPREPLSSPYIICDVLDKYWLESNEIHLGENRLNARFLGSYVIWISIKYHRVFNRLLNIKKITTIIILLI